MATIDFDEETLQRDGGGALTISEARLLLLRAIEREKLEEPANRDPMQIPLVVVIKTRYARRRISADT
jgi:hypothetical protein